MAWMCSRESSKPTGAAKPRRCWKACPCCRRPWWITAASAWRSSTSTPRWRKPGLILVDELAHSNVAGSRHPKCWQDVEELLAAGIDVYSTLNVQHLESLNDVVGGITGIVVHETLPDTFFD